VIVQTPTFTHADAVTAIDRLTTGGGTSVGQGMLTALDAIAGKTLTINAAALSSDSAQVNVGYYGASTIVLLSDGEDTGGPDPVALSGVMSVAGVHVNTIGIGTAAGTTLKVGGFSVHTQLDEAALQQVATTTGGSYFAADDAQSLANVYADLGSRLVVKPQMIEVTALFAGGGTLLLVLGAFASLAWLGRLP
jgi:Ca-activated chloride channel family protein